MHYFEAVGKDKRKESKPITVKVSSSVYEENLYINIPLILEPKEKGGEVTVQSSNGKCLLVDVGFGNTVSIKNTKLIIAGPDDSLTHQSLDLSSRQGMSSAFKSLTPSNYQQGRYKLRI